MSNSGRLGVILALLAASIVGGLTLAHPGAAQVQNAGFLLGTSDRGSPSDGTLYVRIKNFSGGTRNVGIFGYPNFNNIGCGYENIGNQATRQCYVPLNRGAYDRLAWYAYDGSGNLSWGYLDFE